MLNYNRFLAASAAVLCGTHVLTAELYVDPLADEATGNSNLDLTEVSVTNDADSLFIDITTSTFEDWTKYLVFLDYEAGGISGNSNPWFRNVEMGANGIDAFAGIWVDNGGGIDTHANDDSDWFGQSLGSFVGINGSTVSIEFSLDALNIGVGDVVKFDVGTSGGGNGDPATDLLSVGSTAASWGGVATAGELRSYTIVPAPGALALLGLAGVIARRRRA